MKKKAKMNYIGILLLLIFINASSPDRIAVYVAPDGNDTNPGTMQQPLATIERAKEAVKRLKEINPHKNITVFLRRGHYAIQNTVVFHTVDSGQTITYATYPG